MAKKYYYEFKKQLEDNHRNLTIATIFSYSQNENDIEDVISDEVSNDEGIGDTEKSDEETTEETSEESTENTSYTFKKKNKKNKH